MRSCSASFVALNADAGQQAAIALITHAVAGVIVRLAMERPEEITAFTLPDLYRRSLWSVFDTTY